MRIQNLLNRHSIAFANGSLECFGFHLAQRRPEQLQRLNHPPRIRPQRLTLDFGNW